MQGERRANNNAQADWLTAHSAMMNSDTSRMDCHLFMGWTLSAHPNISYLSRNHSGIVHFVAPQNRMVSDPEKWPAIVGQCKGPAPNWNLEPPPHLTGRIRWPSTVATEFMILFNFVVSVQGHLCRFFSSFLNSPFTLYNHCPSSIPNATSLSKFRRPRLQS